jgi:hypothetical protein
MGRAASRKRRSFTKEFKAEVVQLCRAGDRSTSRVAKDQLVHVAQELAFLSLPGDTGFPRRSS